MPTRKQGSTTRDGFALDTAEIDARQAVGDLICIQIQWSGIGSLLHDDLVECAGLVFDHDDRRQIIDIRLGDGSRGLGHVALVGLATPGFRDVDRVIRVTRDVDFIITRPQDDVFHNGVT